MKYLGHEPLGATITDLNLDRLSPDAIREVQELLAEHGVLIFPGQPIDDAGFVTFLAGFGNLIFTAGETPVDGFPDLNIVSNVGRATPPRSTFHTDTSYVRNPPAYTALRAVAIPARGGETIFTNQYRAFETLPADLRSRADGRTITHIVTGLALSDEHETSAEHPIFRRHPISGRTAVYLSTPQRCAAVSGLSTADAAGVVQELFAHSTRGNNTYRHSWSTDDIVMWDNRCVLHRADHSGVIGHRIMHRGMVAEAASMHPGPSRDI